MNRHCSQEEFLAFVNNKKVESIVLYISVEIDREVIRANNTDLKVKRVFMLALEIVELKVVNQEGMYVKLVFELHFSLLAERHGAYNYQFVFTQEIILGQDKAGFNGFSYSNLVVKDSDLRHGLIEKEHRSLYLMCLRAITDKGTTIETPSISVLSLVVSIS